MSGGPKDYGYKTCDGKVECKVRGLCLNNEGKAQFNYEVMRENVLKEIRDLQRQPRQTQAVKTHQIVRDAKNYELYTFPEYKCYQLVYDKRALTLSPSRPTRTDTRKPWTEPSSGPSLGTDCIFCLIRWKGVPPSVMT